LDAVDRVSGKWRGVKWVGVLHYLYRGEILAYRILEGIGILRDVTTTVLESISNGNHSETSPVEKKVLLLKPRGFCAGVVRAIDVVKIAVETFGAPIYVRREIVHNR